MVGEKKERKEKEMIGKPKYEFGDTVVFSVVHDDYKLSLMGVVYIVDAYGTFEQNEEPSYDVMVANGLSDGVPCLYKHIRESEIISSIPFKE